MDRHNQVDVISRASLVDKQIDVWIEDLLRKFENELGLSRYMARAHYLKHLLHEEGDDLSKCREITLLSELVDYELRLADLKMLNAARRRACLMLDGLA